ncbi:MAG: hypothetical protein IOD12_00740 [Silvanigrellales bacterium]|jgi:hypothetical protein|nr:hypothetical protein [Silvanigrellales bacterium]
MRISRLVPLFPVFSFLALGACKARTFNTNLSQSLGQKKGQASGQTSENGASVFDVNDVSVAFPLNKDALARADSFLPPESFQKILELNPTDLPLKDLSAWRIVAFRYDPIATADEQGTLSCQLRLVAQPVIPWGKRARGSGLPAPTGAPPPLWTTEDAALQIVFTLEASAARRAVDALVGLRQVSLAAKAPTQGVPLGIHPGLAQDGGKGQTWQKALAVLEVLRGRVPTFVGVTVSRKKDSQTFTLASYTKSAGSGQRPTLAEALLPVGGKNAITLANFAPGAALGARKGDINPTPLTGDTVYPLVDSGRVVPKNPPEVVEALQATLRIDNPSLSPRSSFFDVDCVSCHVATHVRNAVLVERKDVGLAPNDPHRFVAPEGFTSTLQATLAEDPALVGSVVRQFGYHEHIFTFTERTLNESLEAAAEMSESAAKVGPKK